MTTTIQGYEPDFPEIPDDLIDTIEYRNQEPDSPDGLSGQWFVIDEVFGQIWEGTFANDHSPGSSHNTWCTTYSGASGESEFHTEWKRLEALPEYEPGGLGFDDNHQIEY
jgi:hypothetical protein